MTENEMVDIFSKFLNATASKIDTKIIIVRLKLVLKGH